MVFIVFLLAGLVSLVIAGFKKSKIMIGLSSVFLLISFIIPVGIYSSNIGTIADMEAFYVASNTNFAIARDDTASYLSEDKIISNTTLIPITGSIEKIGLGASVANRIVEYRSAVNDYNSSIARYKAYKNNILYGLAYPEVPSTMRLLVIEKSGK